MQISKILLLLIYFYGKSIKGKTLLQKRMYFLSILLKRNFGYHAYYYGPYSEKVDLALDHNKALGFVAESVSDFMYQKRYEYEVTPDGHELIQHLLKIHPDDCMEVEKAVGKIKNSGDDDDYLKISFAAKVHFISSKIGIDKNKDQIKNEAKKLKIFTEYFMRFLPVIHMVKYW